MLTVSGLSEPLKTNRAAPKALLKKTFSQTYQRPNELRMMRVSRDQQMQEAMSTQKALSDRAKQLDFARLLDEKLRLLERVQNTRAYDFRSRAKDILQCQGDSDDELDDPDNPLELPGPLDRPRTDNCAQNPTQRPAMKAALQLATKSNPQTALKSTQQASLKASQQPSKVTQQPATKTAQPPATNALQQAAAEPLQPVVTGLQQPATKASHPDTFASSSSAEANEWRVTTGMSSVGQSGAGVCLSAQLVPNGGLQDATAGGVYVCDNSPTNEEQCTLAIVGTSNVLGGGSTTRPSAFVITRASAKSKHL